MTKQVAKLEKKSKVKSSRSHSGYTLSDKNNVLMIMTIEAIHENPLTQEESRECVKMAKRVVMSFT